MQTSLDRVSNAGYLLIDCIEEAQGTMLSNTRTENQRNTELRRTFFQELSSILLSLSRIPLPRIGSFIIDGEGFLTLTNRPVPMDRNLRRGPFAFMLTDLHQSNISVDDKWHITCLVDLEWACSRPVQMIEPSYWLINQSVDEIDVEEFDKLREELMAIMCAEEAEHYKEDILRDAEGTPLRISEIMEQAWKTGTFWYSLALSSPTGLFRLFYERIQPLLSNHGSDDIGEIMPFYWGKSVGKFVATKLSDKRKYDQELQLAFSESSVEG